MLELLMRTHNEMLLVLFYLGFVGNFIDIIT